jgi:hypothetical protein
MHDFLMHWSVIATKFDTNIPLEGAVPASILYIYDTNFVPNIMQIFLVITKKRYIFCTTLQKIVSNNVP